MKRLFCLIVGISLLACGGRQREEAKQYVQHYVNQAQDVAVKATTPAIECDAKVPNDPPNACLSGVLHCGDVVMGTTEGGDSVWDDDFYAQKFCFPAGAGHQAPERVYSMDIPEYTQVTFDLQTDCVDLDLVAVSWLYEGSCPDVRHAIFECDGSNQRGWDRVLVQTFQKRSYIVGVDGKGNAVGPYKLTVKCEHILKPEERVKLEKGS